MVRDSPPRLTPKNSIPIQVRPRCREYGWQICPCGRCVLVLRQTSIATGLRSTAIAFLLSLVTSDLVSSLLSVLSGCGRINSCFDSVLSGVGYNVSLMSLRPMPSTVLSASTVTGPLWTVTVLDDPLPPICTSDERDAPTEI